MCDNISVGVLYLMGANNIKETKKNCMKKKLVLNVQVKKSVIAS